MEQVLEHFLPGVLLELVGVKRFLLLFLELLLGSSNELESTLLCIYVVIWVVLDIVNASDDVADVYMGPFYAGEVPTCVIMDGSLIVIYQSLHVLLSSLCILDCKVDD